MDFYCTRQLFCVMSVPFKKSKHLYYFIYEYLWKKDDKNMTFVFWKCILENQIVYLCFSAVVLILTSRLLICLVDKQNNEVNIQSQHRRRKKWMCLFKVFWSRPGHKANLYPVYDTHFSSFCSIDCQCFIQFRNCKVA